MPLIKINNRCWKDFIKSPQHPINRREMLRQGVEAAVMTVTLPSTLTLAGLLGSKAMAAECGASSYSGIGYNAYFGNAGPCTTSFLYPVDQNGVPDSATVAVHAAKWGLNPAAPDPVTPGNGGAFPVQVGRGAYLDGSGRFAQIWALTPDARLCSQALWDQIRAKVSLATMHFATQDDGGFPQSAGIPAALIMDQKQPEIMANFKYSNNGNAQTLAEADFFKPAINISAQATVASLANSVTFPAATQTSPDLMANTMGYAEKMIQRVLKPLFQERRLAAQNLGSMGCALGEAKDRVGNYGANMFDPSIALLSAVQAKLDGPNRTAAALAGLSGFEASVLSTAFNSASNRIACAEYDSPNEDEHAQNINTYAANRDRHAMFVKWTILGYYLAGRRGMCHYYAGGSASARGSQQLTQNYTEAGVTRSITSNMPTTAADNGSQTQIALVWLFDPESAPEVRSMGWLDSSTGANVLAGPLMNDQRRAALSVALTYAAFSGNTRARDFLLGLGRSSSVLRSLADADQLFMYRG